MKNIEELIRQKEFELRQKELAVQQLSRELEALRLASRLIAEAQAAPAPRSAAAPRPAPAAPLRPVMETGNGSARPVPPRQFP
jgi:hypothetical protein